MIITVKSDGHGARLDSWLAKEAELSRSNAIKLIDEGRVMVNGKSVPKRHTLSEGDTVSYDLPEPVEYTVVSENIPLDIVFEDEWIIVINKPKGMVVHPAPGNYTGTLVNALMFHCGDSLSGIGGVSRPGIVHRIDKDTSGLLVVAKCDEAHAKLSEELSYHGIEREYHALVRGGFSCDTGTVSYPIGRHPVDRKKMAVIRDGSHTAREATTHYTVLDRFGEVSHLALRLETGRTHQIRVHMSYIGHPLLGDELYGGGSTKFEARHPRLFNGQALHAAKLTLTHPKTGERMTFVSPLPEEFTRALKLLGEEYNN